MAVEEERTTVFGADRDSVTPPADVLAPAVAHNASAEAELWV
jgi:hypothetical protein